MWKTKPNENMTRITPVSATLRHQHMESQTDFKTTQVPTYAQRIQFKNC